MGPTLTIATRTNSSEYGFWFASAWTCALSLALCVSTSIDLFHSWSAGPLGLTTRTRISHCCSAYAVNVVYLENRNMISALRAAICASVTMRSAKRNQLQLLHYVWFLSFYRTDLSTNRFILYVIMYSIWVNLLSLIGRSVQSSYAIFIHI